MGDVEREVHGVTTRMGHVEGGIHDATARIGGVETGIDGVVAQIDGLAASLARMQPRLESLFPANLGDTLEINGSPLTVAGYKVYWGTSPGNYPNVKALPAGVASDVVTPLAAGTWYFVVTALDGNNVESGYSNMAQKTL